MRRLSSPLAVATSCLLILTPGPVAADYPTRPIMLLVPFAAGGTTDIVARIMAEHMAKTLGQAITIENDAGAGGTTVTRRAAQAPPDGYTLVMGTMGTHGVAPSQYHNLKYDPARDFTPVGLTAGLPAVIVTRKDFPPGNLREFVSYVQENQSKVNEGHAGDAHLTASQRQDVSEHGRHVGFGQADGQSTFADGGLVACRKPKRRAQFCSSRFRLVDKTLPTQPTSVPSRSMSSADRLACKMVPR